MKQNRTKNGKESCDEKRQLSLIYFLKIDFRKIFVKEFLSFLLLPESLGICDLRNSFENNKFFETHLTMNGREGQGLISSTVKLQEILKIALDVKNMIVNKKRVSTRREVELWTEKI